MTMPKWLLKIIFFIVVLCTLVTLQGCSFSGNSNKKLPDGWLVIPHLSAVQAIAVYGDTIWAGCEDGVYQINRQSGAIVQKLKSNPPMTYVKALLVDKSGVLYIGHFNGLTRYDGANYQTLTTKDGLPDNRVNALLFDKLGRLWVGTWGGAAYLDNNRTWHVIKAANGLIDNMVNVLFQDNRGGMWFGSYVAPRGGVSYLRDDGTWQLFSVANGLPHNDVTSIIQDDSGNVWVGTGFLYQGGAARFEFIEKSVVIQQVLTQHDGLAGGKVRSEFEDKDGVMWFGSEYDGLARWGNGKWRVLTEKDGLPHYEVMAMLQDADGSLWMGTQNGVVRLNYAALQAFR